MLTYLILTTRALLMASIVAGVITGYIKGSGDTAAGRSLIAGAVAGLIASIVMTVFKNNTSLVTSSFWNNVIYVTSIVSVLVILVSYIPALRALYVLRWVAAAVFIAMLMLYSLPDVFSYPHKVLLTERTIISTDFLYDMIGMVLGIVLAVVMFFASDRCALRLGGRGTVIVTLSELLLMTARYMAGFFSVLLQEQIVRSNHAMFQFSVFIKNHTDELMFASMAVIVLSAVILIVRSVNVNEPYKNPAEHRRIRARWMYIRRWSLTVIIASVIGILNVTAVDAYNTTDTSLSPIEECEMDDENMYVSFEQVSDGHLHRFGYETEDGVIIRFIVIQKSNANTFGVGLDACDVCGETGYYERDDQVVCNLCDVVMNVSTIGFKGGCNPIVIPYEIKDGRIIVPIDGLLEYESEFK